MLVFLTSLAAAGPILQIETDPTMFVFRGGALHLRTTFPEAPRVTVGVGGYAMDLPSPMVELWPANRGEGWTAHLQGVGAFVDVHPHTPDRGLTLGVQVAAHRWSLRRPRESPEPSRMAALLVMPRVGYEWYPVRSLGLYVFPWLGVGTTRRIGATAEVAGEPYTLAALQVLPAVHVGWRLGEPSL